MPRVMQGDYIERATKILSNGLGRHPGAFRLGFGSPEPRGAS